MKVYLSSTFQDLEDHRRRVYQALRGLRLDVVAMEDYVARDERPVDHCLADVASADLYVGVFAFRYGHVPEVDNPEGRSITELEYRKAGELGIPRLVFLLHEEAAWPRKFDDAVTGEGDNGGHIRRLREELARDHLMRPFRTTDELERAVLQSVGLRLSERGHPVGSRPARSVVPYPRQLQFDLLLLHAPADGDDAVALIEALGAVWRVKASSAGLIAESSEELEVLDRLVASVRSVAVLLSASSMAVLEEDRVRSSRALRLARDRTGVLLGVAVHDLPADVGEAWGLTEVVAPNAGVDGGGIAGVSSLLHAELVRHIWTSDGPEVGLPVIVVAMTAPEATALLADPPASVAALLAQSGGPRSRWTDRYGATRWHWRPFSDTTDTIEEVLRAAVAGVNEDANRLKGRTIRLQPYSLEPLMREPLLMWQIYQAIARNGCLVVVDELSLFHEEVRGGFEQSPLPAGEQVALVTMSPLDPVDGTPHALIREELARHLQHATRRFGERLDPLCEMGVPERRRFIRWLHGSLPRTVDVLRDAARDDEKVRQFAEELQIRPNPAMSRLIGGEGSQG